MSWAYSPDVMNLKLSYTQLAVLRALCYFYNDNKTTRTSHNCYPSVKTIARVTGFKTGAVNKAKSALSEKGLITWFRHMDILGEKMETNQYTINCPKLERKLKRNETALGIGIVKRDENGTPSKSDEEQYEEFMSKPAILKAGLMYYPPNRDELKRSLPSHFTEKQVSVMYDALEFVFDTPEHRQTLTKLLADSGHIEQISAAVARARNVSMKGKTMPNRMGYLVQSIKNAIAKSESTQPSVPNKASDSSVSASLPENDHP